MRLANKRSPWVPRATRRQFQRTHSCPADEMTAGPCPGYVIDHIVTLKRTGTDNGGNMQWQRVAEAMAKDRIELRLIVSECLA